ncbi:MAG: hypothetical protein JNL92_20580 [Opitutaceae bacterium]|nr:hypothetical protein [Opitutaceae bacterium]
MKTSLLLLAFGLTAPLLAADASKIILKGASVSVEEARASGSASATVGDVSISAEVITFEKERNVLRCEGAVVIRTSAAVVTAKDCTVQLIPGEKKVFFLSSGAIQVAPAMEPLPRALVPKSK